MGRWSPAVQGLSLAVSAYQQGRAHYERWRDERSYIVTVSSDDEFYEDVHRWLLTQMPPESRKSLLARTDRRNVMANGPDGGGRRMPPRVVYEYDGRREVTVTLGGHRVTVSVERTSSGDEEKSSLFARQESRIAFVARTLAGQREVMRTLERIAKEYGEPETPRTFIVARWGGWNSTTVLPVRDPRTVVLGDGQYERLSGDLRQFLSSEELYARIGVPWHRGYLLHGPPGGGKTSAVRALAGEHKLDVFYLPLSDVKADMDLVALFSSIPDRSILLLEDVDVTHAAVSRDDTVPGLSAQGLLNALDGAITPHGLVTFMTTNRLEALDKALVRKGRCDVTEEIGYLSDQQLRRLVRVMTGVTGPLPEIGGRQVSPADVVEIVKRNITDMQTAHAEIVRFLTELREGVSHAADD